MRRAAAATRHFVWTCGIVVAALVPVAALVMPKWQVAAPTAVAALAPVIRTSVETTGAVATPPATAQADRIAQPVAPAAKPAPRFASVSSLATVIWAIGAVAVLLYLFAGTTAAMWIRRSSRALHGRSADDVEALADAMGIQRPTVFADANVSSPMASGVLRPCIFLPPDAASWPDDRLHVVLLHELAHIKRRDCLTQAVAQIVCGVYWFNPLTWIAARRLRTERERACDDFVLAAGTR